MSGNRTDFDTDDDREHFDPAFEESFQEEPDTDDTACPAGFATTAAGRTADGETSGISITAAEIFRLNTDKTLRGLQTYQDDTKDSDFVYAAEAGADMMQREWSGKTQYYTGSGVMVGACCSVAILRRMPRNTSTSAFAAQVLSQEACMVLLKLYGRQRDKGGG
jgi:hypothetical protein